MTLVRCSNVIQLDARTPSGSGLFDLAATALVKAGADVKTAQARLGHSSSQMTLDVYARATVDADRSAADAVSAFLRPSRT